MSGMIVAFSVGQDSVLLCFSFVCIVPQAYIAVFALHSRPCHFSISFVLYTIGAVTVFFPASHSYRIIDHQRHSVERISITSYFDFCYQASIRLHFDAYVVTAFASWPLPPLGSRVHTSWL